MKGLATISMELRSLIQGEVLDDQYSMGMYATDSSLYQIFPLCVCLPKTKADVIEITRVANKYSLPVLARGGATSLAGQTVAKAIVIDFSKYLDQVLEYNKEERWLRVQPGITRDAINRFVEKDRLHFAPDPATSDRATAGGMIANNSSGTKSIYYGKTSDHLIEIEFLLSNGEVLNFQEVSPEEYQLICEGLTTESIIYQEIRNLISQQSENISKAFPKVMRRVSGYALDHFTLQKNWNLAQLVCGSEGTLGIILSAKISLEPLPKAKILSVFHFQSRKEAVDSVSDIIAFGPSAVEMIDYNILELSKDNPICLEYHEHCILGNPQAVLITEFYGNSKQDAHQKLNRCIQQLSDNNQGYDYPVFETLEDMHKVWMLRKQGLGLIMGKPGNKKPIPFIEDCAIPLPHLSTYVQQIENLCKELDTEMVIYAHASVGVLHIRPILDTREQADLEKLKLISAKALYWVKQYGGSWSGEHGDGIVRSPNIREFYGEEIYRAFKKIKALFDPNNIMNPNKIVDPKPIDKDLRYGPGYHEKKWDSIFKFRELGSFNAVVHNCSGIGACRKLESGTMCPSFMATRDEEHSTRGRANALRLALSGQFKTNELPDKRLLQVMDLCLSCKGCKTECPSNVDMAKLKSEVLQKKYDQGNLSLREKLVRDSFIWSKRNTGKVSAVINKIQASRIFRYSFQKLMGLDPERKLPEYSNESLVNWFSQRPAYKNPEAQVVLFADTYCNYHEVNVGKAAVELLEACEYEVILADAGCCQRARISNGFLKLAKRDGTKTAINLMEYLEKGIPILVLEPSCGSALQSDLPDLIDSEETAKLLQDGVFLMDEFLGRQVEEKRLKGHFKSKFQDIVVHGHCHQKALYGLKGMQRMYDHDPQCLAKTLDSGCCGMAGAFGYEIEHSDISQKVGNLKLFPAIKENPDAMIVANGFSCRHQISHCTSRKTLHWVETIEFEKFES